MAGEAITTARCPNCARLERRIAELEERVTQLERLLENATRAQKRPAAPFSKGTPKPDPKKPGRKPGDHYGPKAHRLLPEQKPDEIIDVPLPEHCPECGGPAEQAVRPLVVNRKVFGGNRTASGGHAQEILGSVFATLTKRALNTLSFVSNLICSPADQRPRLIQQLLPASSNRPIDVLYRYAPSFSMDGVALVA